MLFYHITTGALYRDDEFLGMGYSGAGMGANSGRNNLEMVRDPDKGPIPPGLYAIGIPYTHRKEGPLTMNLTPQPGTDVFGRFAFHIHGNNAINNASHGCIILGPTIRKNIIMCGDAFITVLAT
jgi:hypothetical protein